MPKQQDNQTPSARIAANMGLVPPTPEQDTPQRDLTPSEVRNVSIDGKTLTVNDTTFDLDEYDGVQIWETHNGTVLHCALMFHGHIKAEAPVATLDEARRVEELANPYLRSRHPGIWAV